MTTLTVTAAQVRPLHGAVVRRFFAGGTVSIGAVVYVDSSGTVQHTAGGAIGTTKTLAGIAVATPDGGTSAASGERVDVVVSGPVAGFSSMTPGTVGFVSNTAGGVEDAAGTKSAIVGVAIAADTFLVRPQVVDLS
ncbi:MAG: hypothetical protein KDH89_19355 [Anaerolineae bacterium]|nr:hypothetical protein [Anaerolineae bacterium]